MKEIAHAISLSMKRAKRIAIFIVGVTILVTGMAMILLPGPAIVVIPVGLAILGTEFMWARRLLLRIKNKASAARASVMNKVNDNSRGRK